MKSPLFDFRRALPVWQAGTETDMNCHISFVTKLSSGLDNPILSLAGSCTFVVAINGEFIAHGPARCAHGFYRVDQLALAKYLTGGDCVLSIRVAGYYARSFSNLRQPSFLCAEITDGDKVIAWTSENDPEDGHFRAYPVVERITRVQRYSYQRPFVEHYRLGHDAFAYERGEGRALPVTLASQGNKTFIVRTQPYGDYPVVSPRGMVAEGVVTYSDKDHYYADRSIVAVGPGQPTDGFAEDELEVQSYREVGRMDFQQTAKFFCRSAQQISLATDGYADVDLGCNVTGILDFTVETTGGCELFILFDEFFADDGSLNPFRMSTSNVFYYKLAAGSCHIHTCEPYCMRAVRFVVRHGFADIRGFKMFKVGFPTRLINARLNHGDEQLQKIYDAAVESFTANAADIYMDCPSRERAGWLCDSFFTSRVERVLTGGSYLERAFLENFLLPDSFGPRVPAGMLPMCYPSDFWEDNMYIPNWAMWYVLEMEEYFDRSGNRQLVDMAKDRLYALLSWFRQYENEDGLLEKLPGWVFVEWSRANQLTQDVNFPTNMVYAAMKAALGRLYGDAALVLEAGDMKEKILSLSYLKDKGFFCDNMVRRDGKLVLSGECTETCQYYAFFFRIATPDSHPVLWKRLINDFGYDREKTGAWPEIAPANAFIGNYLRMDLFAREKMYDVLIDNIRGYFTYMADKTGTLWENIGAYASCNHGFASHVLVWMDEAGLLVHEEN